MEGVTRMLDEGKNVDRKGGNVYTQLTETYKYLNGHYRTPPENKGRTRGHSQKLFKQRARLDQKKNFYPMKIVDTWNNLPANVAEATTIDGSTARRCTAIVTNERRASYVIPLNSS